MRIKYTSDVFFCLVTIVGNNQPQCSYNISKTLYAWELKLFMIFLQSIFGFSGANISGFNSFRKDFPNHKEVRCLSYFLASVFVTPCQHLLGLLRLHIVICTMLYLVLFVILTISNP